MCNVVTRTGSSFSYQGVSTKGLYQLDAAVGAPQHILVCAIALLAPALSEHCAAPLTEKKRDPIEWDSARSKQRERDRDIALAPQFQRS